MAVDSSLTMMKAGDRLQNTKQARMQQPTINRRVVKASSG
jgi:hypothetical protein